MTRKPHARRRALRHALTLAVATALLSPAFATAHAQAAATPDGSREATELDAVIVTGRSGIQERSKAETSYSVTRIDEERLRMQAPTSVTEAMKSVPGFWVADAGASYEWISMGWAKSFKLKLDVTNLFDKDYFSSVGTNGFVVSDPNGLNYTLNAGAPRQVFLTADIRF